MKTQAMLRAFLFIAFAVTVCSGAERSEAVVRIGGCSGVSVSDSGMILTAKHCRLKNYLTVEWPSGQKSRAVQLVRSRNGDGPTVFLCEGTRGSRSRNNRRRSAIKSSRLATRQGEGVIAVSRTASAP